jgi:hypothetical protein
MQIAHYIRFVTMLLLINHFVKFFHNIYNNFNYKFYGIYCRVPTCTICCFDEIYKNLVSASCKVGFITDVTKEK